MTCDWCFEELDYPADDCEINYCSDKCRELADCAIAESIAKLPFEVWQW